MLTHDAKPTGSTHSSPLCGCQRSEVLRASSGFLSLQTDALTSPGSTSCARHDSGHEKRPDCHRTVTAPKRKLTTSLQGHRSDFDRVDCLNDRDSGALFAGRPITIARSPPPSSSTKTWCFGKPLCFGAVPDTLSRCEQFW
jgi:hypothetical protein